MKPKFIAHVSVKIGFLVVVISGIARAQPHLFYSDLDSGPKSGGENKGGAYVTVYGSGFGVARGTSTVTVGGGRAVAYPIWTDAKVAFQLGPEAATGDVVMTTQAGVSNGLPFTVRPGKIHFVAVSGSNSNAGSSLAPWASLPYALQKMAPGDITYARNGVAQTKDDGAGWNACLTFNANSGALGNPKALVVYPGESATIGSVQPNPEGGCNSGIRNEAKGENYWTIAGFNMRGGGEALTLYFAHHWRIVGNDLTCPNGNGQSACLETSLGEFLYIFGNNVHDVATNLNPGKVSALYHGVYFSTDSNHIWFGYNTIARVQGCRGLQVHSTPLDATKGRDQFDLHVFNNIIHDTQCDGIVMTTVDPSKGPVEIYNNLIYNAGTGPKNQEGTGAWNCINVQTYTGTGTPGSGTVEVYGNTLYGCGTFASPPYAGSNAGVSWSGPNANKKLRLRNNIFFMTAKVPYITVYDASGHLCSSSRHCDAVSGSHNLFYGQGAAPSGFNLTNSVTADPMFVNAGAADFHLGPGSPAAVAGTATPRATDFNGVPLSSSSGSPIGAYASVTSAATSAKPKD